jgi:hypothetical protein
MFASLFFFAINSLSVTNFRFFLVMNFLISGLVCMHSMYVKVRRNQGGKGKEGSMGGRPMREVKAIVTINRVTQLVCMYRYCGDLLTKRT